MPAKNEKQAKLFRAALGDPKPGTGAAKIKATVPREKIKDFTYTEGVDETLNPSSLRIMQAVNILAEYIVEKGASGVQEVQTMLQKRVSSLKQNSTLKETIARLVHEVIAENNKL